MNCCPVLCSDRWACNSRRGDRKQFQPNYVIHPLTRKFYARHDEVKDKESPIAKRHLELLDNRKTFDLRKHRYTPLTENQMYGWLEGRAYPVNQKGVPQRRVIEKVDDTVEVRAAVWRACRGRLLVAR